MKKETGIKLRKLIERLIREEKNNDFSKKTSDLVIEMRRITNEFKKKYAV